jgi:hypothetical protein
MRSIIMYSSIIIITMIMRNMRWAGHGAYIYNIYLKMDLKNRWKDNIHVGYNRNKWTT